MNKMEFVSAIAEQAGLSKKDAASAVDAFTTVVTNELANGGEVSLVGFGKFRTSERQAREGRNPQTGETIKIDAKVSPKFTPSKNLKEAIN